MIGEAYSVGFEKANFHAPIRSNFNGEQVLKAREAEIADNLISYVGEYRMGVKFDEFFYSVDKDTQTGQRFLTSKDSLPIRDVYRKAIYEREKNGLSVRREVAECLGFEKLEQELLQSREGTMAVWVSPPGEKKDGYGDYSFTFIGQVVADENGKRVRMIPYRNVNSISEHNRYLSELTGEDINFKEDTEFLRTPFIISQNTEFQSPEDILKKIGEKEKFDNSWRNNFMRDNGYLIHHFLYQVRNNYSDEDLSKTLNAIEFAASQYKDKENTFLIDEGKEVFIVPSAQDYVAKWGTYELPKVKGSCGPNGEDLSNLSTPMEFQNTFSNRTTDEEDEYGSLKFKCPEKSCGKENVRPRGKLLQRCQHCRSTKVAC